MTPGTVTIQALPGFGEINPGDSLPALIATQLHCSQAQLRSSDVIVIAQKVVSKAENRFIDLRTITPGPQALELSGRCGKDPRLVEVILRESSEVLRVKQNVLIVRHTRGYVLAHAGVDRSNVGSPIGGERVLLLPLDPDASAARLRSELQSLVGVEIGVIISDSFGRPWRLGVVNVAVGAAGVASLWDRRGEVDREGRRLEVTIVGWADAIAAAAGLAMGEGAEGTPVILVQGLRCHGAQLPAAALLRPVSEDLFR